MTTPSFNSSATPADSARIAARQRIIQDTADRSFSGDVRMAEHFWNNPGKAAALEIKIRQEVMVSSGRGQAIVDANTPRATKLPAGMARNAEGFTYSVRLGFATPSGATIPEHRAAKLGVDVDALKAAAAASLKGAQL